MAAPLIITLDRAAGTARMQRGAWSNMVPIAKLTSQLRFYQMLWARGSKTKDHSAPGPWAQHYGADLVALRAAIREVQNGG